MALGLKNRLGVLQEMIGKRPDKAREKVSAHLAKMAASPNSANADSSKDFTLPQGTEKHVCSTAMPGGLNKAKIILEAN